MWRCLMLVVIFVAAVQVRSLAGLKIKSVAECKLQCAHSGVLNKKTCSCTGCARGWAGVDCTRQCKDYSERCGPDFWPKYWCDEDHPEILENCLLMCGLCEPQCANAGVFNDVTKSCHCAKGWTGRDCTRECKDYQRKCGANPGWPKKMCTKKYPYVQETCPLMCGICERVCKLNCTSPALLNKETCSCSGCPRGWTGADCKRKCTDYSDRCSKFYWTNYWCDEKNPYVLETCPLTCHLCDPQCANSGVYNEVTKRCYCKKGWAGLDCSRKCINYNKNCGATPGWPASWCERYKNVERYRFIRDECPKMCYLCFECNNDYYYCDARPGMMKPLCNHAFVQKRCPLLCGLCEPQCANSGHFNEETRSCNCANGWTGADCTRKCKNYNRNCGSHLGWPKFWCATKQFVRDGCPLMCHQCAECKNTYILCESHPRMMKPYCFHPVLKQNCPLLCGICEKL